MILEMIVGATLIVLGYALSEYTRRTDKKEIEDVTIRHAKTSLRSPLKTYDLEYSKYKSKDGLYEPHQPKRGD